MSEQSEGMNQYTPESGDELFSEMEQLVGAE
jgi:hypothetical protein